MYSQGLTLFRTRSVYTLVVGVVTSRFATVTILVSHQGYHNRRWITLNEGNANLEKQYLDYLSLTVMDLFSLKHSHRWRPELEVPHWKDGMRDAQCWAWRIWGQRVQVGKRQYAVNRAEAGWNREVDSADR